MRLILNISDKLLNDEIPTEDDLMEAVGWKMTELFEDCTFEHDPHSTNMLNIRKL